MKFLESIGTAQMEQELQKRVLTIAKENSDVMTEETGVQPSLTEDEMKEYLNMVVNEIRRTKHDEA
jgi:transcription initiation factor IIE alpha subunit